MAKLTPEQIAHDITIATLPKIFDLKVLQGSNDYDPYEVYKELYKKLLVDVKKDNV